MTLLRSLALGAAASAAVAQAPPANIGAWEQIAVSPTSPSLGPYGWFAHKPTTVAGCYIASGGDPTAPVGSNLTAAFQFDMTTLSWSRYPDAPSWTCAWWRAGGGRPGGESRPEGGGPGVRMALTNLEPPPTLPP
jgi:hypothetical protein